MDTIARWVAILGDASGAAIVQWSPATLADALAWARSMQQLRSEHDAQLHGAQLHGPAGASSLPVSAPVPVPLQQVVSALHPGVPHLADSQRVLLRAVLANRFAPDTVFDAALAAYDSEYGLTPEARRADVVSVNREAVLTGAVVDMLRETDVCYEYASTAKASDARFALPHPTASQPPIV